MLEDFISLFFPKICFGCGCDLVHDERNFCLSCNFELPFANFSNSVENELEKTFRGRVQIEEATSLFIYQKKSIVQNVIHQLKYRNQEKIGSVLGELLASEILISNRFKSLDMIIPIPLHRTKLKSRGYNQNTNFGLKLSEKLNIPFEENLLLINELRATQTYKHRDERVLNLENNFTVSDSSKIENKHILLIDDVVTTGATIENASLALLNFENVKISIASMAYTF